ncbi:hypothetical protein F4778DRAFT_785947 [Xylariomycetidae sp. FL2044]|nr:hypothetical protein F4778DRAFT_785947 [Xylariomycetidae sp. FL2044]
MSPRVASSTRVLRHPFRLSWRTRVDDQVESILLNLPLELLDMILDMLPPESVVALSLSCKAAFGLFFTKSISRLDECGTENLLLLLERDLSRDLIYCYSCGRLHCFQPTWSLSDCTSDHFMELPCKPECGSFGKLRLGLHNARLVMNTYYFGPGRGLSLSNLECAIAPGSRGRDAWGIESKAAITQGQLFLLVRHTLALVGTRQGNRQDIMRRCPHRVCHHVSTHEPASGAFEDRQLPELNHLKADYSYGYLETQQSSPTSCAVCLTDFTTTIERETRVTAEVLNIVVVAYHQLGDLRPPLDWKWQPFATRWPSPSLFREKQQNGTGDYRPVAVKRCWDLGIEPSVTGLPYLELPGKTRTSNTKPHPQVFASGRSATDETKQLSDSSSGEFLSNGYKPAPPLRADTHDHALGILANRLAELKEKRY